MVAKFTLVLDEKTYEVEWHGERVLVDSQPFGVSFPEPGVVEVDGRRRSAELQDGRAVVEGITYAWSVQADSPQESQPDRGTAAAGGNGAHNGALTVDAIMPGKVVDVLVKPGDEVQMDQVVLVLEAMKMQNEIRAGHAGVIKEVSVQPGQDVSLGAVLVVIDPGDGE